MIDSFSPLKVAESSIVVSKTRNLFRRDDRLKQTAHLFSDLPKIKTFCITQDKRLEFYLFSCKGFLNAAAGRVVQHIFNLELQMINLHEVSITFEGQRHRQYVNQEPKNIQLLGSCSISSQ
jgi:hypothetical protein